MNHNNFQDTVISATKWSAITEVVAKFVMPLSNMILARILAPEAFGVVATVTMITSFADMFTDAGFQKYLIQHEFKNEDEKFTYANIAFITNFIVSILLWGIIILMRHEIARLVGNPGLGNVIAIASFQLILTSFSSIQMALFRRNLDFKSLFAVRLLSVCVPFVITLPLGLLGFSYWSIIIGNIFTHLSNAVILTVKSKWKPKKSCDYKILKKMLSFSIWTLIESISIWLTTWVDTFIIGSLLSQYYLGLYKTSTSMVNALMAIITSSTTTVLFSTLSRLQNDDSKFNYVFLKFQRLVSILIFPLGIGVYLYRDLATQIILGNQWKEASEIIGVWALTSSIMIVFGYYSSEVYRAKGRPKLSFIAQILHLIFLVPACIISSRYGFWTLIYTRSWIRMQFVIVHLIIMNFIIGIPVVKIIENVLPTGISSIAMGLFGYYLQNLNSGLMWTIFSIIMCIIFYFGLLCLFPNLRREIMTLLRRLTPKKLSLNSHK